jgi:hypothetical protein
MVDVADLNDLNLNFHYRLDEYHLFQQENLHFVYHHHHLMFDHPVLIIIK